ncbi:MAG: Lrp/AsnC family transcriptional regulator [Chloroflexota bacterium]|nr:MAG: Lrp/AsnC family transcriptional regulator [Chloroflexota bacterium]
MTETNETRETIRKVLRILERDCLTDPKQIAIMLGTDETDVAAIIAAAQAHGTIVRHKAVINWERAGDPYVLALIEVKVTPQRETGFDAIAERIYRFPEARSVYLVSGTYDLAVQVHGRSMQDIASFVASKLAPLDGVQSTVTHFMLRRYKEDGDILVSSEQAERLPITP